MAALILPSRRVVQPQGPVEPDWSNPLTVGLQFAHTPANIAGSTRTVGTFQGSSYLPGTADSAQTLAMPTPKLYLGSLQNSTVFAVGSTRAGMGSAAGQIGNGGRALFSERAASGNNIYKIIIVRLNDGSPSIEFTYRNDAGTLLQQRTPQGTGVFNDGRLLSVFGVKNGTSHTVRVNGFSITGTFGSGSSAFTDGGLVRQVGGDRGDVTSSWIGKIDLVAGWTRSLSATELKALEDNPWQLFRPIQRRIWVPVAGGGGISQTVSFTLEDVSASVSQNLSHAQSLTGTLDGVTVSISQTVQHSQALDAALDGVTFAASQTLSHSQALDATLDGVTVEINQSAAPSSKEQSLAVVLDGIQVAIAQEGPANLIDTHDGFWAKEWARIRAREKRKYQEEIQERVEEIQDEIAEVEQQIVEVKQAPKPKKATPARDFYAEQARIVEHLIARRNQLIDEEDEELLLLL